MLMTAESPGLTNVMVGSEENVTVRVSGVSQSNPHPLVNSAADVNRTKARYRMT
jgi:hypothetical protein